MPNAAPDAPPVAADAPPPDPAVSHAPSEASAAGTAVVPVPAEPARSVRQQARADMSLADRERLRRDAIASEVAGALMAQDWGKNLTEHQARELARYGTAYGIDVLTEIHVLGGRIYLNAAFYENRLAPLIHAGVLEYATADNISPDPRLDDAINAGINYAGPEIFRADVEAQAVWAYREKLRRERERVNWKIPPTATTAFVGRIKARAMPGEITDAKWHQQGRKITRRGQNNSTYEADADPVGDLSPVETVVSRALRRVAKRLVTHVPQLAALIHEITEAGKDLSDLMVEQRTRDRAAREEYARTRYHGGVSVGTQADPYGLDTPPAVPVARSSKALGAGAAPGARPQAPVVAAVPFGPPSAAALACLSEPDPYGEPAPPPPPVPAVEAPPAAATPAPDAGALAESDVRAGRMLSDAALDAAPPEWATAYAAAVRDTVDELTPDAEGEGPKRRAARVTRAVDGLARYTPAEEGDGDAR